MAYLEVLIITMAATLVSTEPPVPQGFQPPYNYQAPSSYNPSNSYIPPTGHSYNNGNSGYSGGRNSYSAGNSGYSGGSNSYSGGNGGYSGGSNSYSAGNSGYSGGSNSYSGGSDSYSGGSSGYDASGYDGGQGHDGYEGHGHGHDNEVPKSYEFGYSVKDAQSGNDYGRQETSDGNTVRGEYRVLLPDGRTQIVSYHADWKTGFHADVRYEGEARYPEPQKQQGQQSGYNYDAPDYSGSISGFSGNNNRPSNSYGPPGYH